MVLITAVITTHKREPEMVRRALESVLTQTHKPLQVVVVDDSPRDFSHRAAVAELVAGYGVQYIAHDTCQGACAARNTGLAAAQGQFIAFLDDDDVWKPEKLQRQLEGFQKESVALVYCRHELLDTATGKVEQRYPTVCQGRIFDELIKANFIGSTSFPLMRTEALRQIGGFDVQMPSSQDHDVWLRLAERYEVAYVDAPLVTYYVHSGDQISKNYARVVGGLSRIDRKHRQYLQTHPQAFCCRGRRLAAAYAGNRQPAEALGLWLRCIVKSPLQLRENIKCLYGILRLLWIGRKTVKK